MPQLVKTLDTADYGRKTAQHKLDLAPYHAILEDLTPGQGAHVALDPGEAQRVVKRRLSMAAKERGHGLQWRAAPAGHVHLRVTSAPKATKPRPTA